MRRIKHTYILIEDSVLIGLVYVFLWMVDVGVTWTAERPWREVRWISNRATSAWWRTQRARYPIRS